MKKIIIPVLVLLAIAALVMPWVTGSVAERVTRDMVAQLNVQSSDYGETAIVDYQRGYRNSETMFEWQPPGEIAELFADQDEPLMRYRCAGTHGLISYDYQCELVDVPGYREFVDEELGGNNPLSFVGSVNVFGSTTQTLRLDAFELAEEDGAMLTIKGGHMDFQGDQSLQNIVVDGRFAGLDAFGGDDQSKLSLGPAQVNGAFAINQYKMTIGDLNLTLEGMQTSDAEDGALSFGDLTLDAWAREKGENLSAGYRFAIKSMALEEGPAEATQDALDMRNLQAEFSVDGVNMAQLATVTENVQKIGREMAAQAKLDNPEAGESYENAMLLSMLPEFESLLVKGLGLNGSFSADYANQPLTASIDFELLRDLSLGDFVLLSVQPKALFAKLKVALGVVVPETLLQRDPEAALAVRQSPWYQKTETGYAANLTLDGDAVDLNGRRMEIEEFINFVMQSMVPVDSGRS